METEALVVTVMEAARLLRLSRGATYEAIRAKEIPSCRIGRRILIPRAALLAKLASAGAPQGGTEGAPSDGRS